jgi:hypothetical protein
MPRSSGQEVGAGRRFASGEGFREGEAAGGFTQQVKKRKGTGTAIAWDVPRMSRPRGERRSGPQVVHWGFESQG